MCSDLTFLTVQFVIGLILAVTNAVTYDVVQYVKVSSLHTITLQIRCCVGDLNVSFIL